VTNRIGGLEGACVTPGMRNRGDRTKCSGLDARARPRSSGHLPGEISLMMADQVSPLSSVRFVGEKSSDENPPPEGQGRTVSMCRADAPFGRSEPNVLAEATMPNESVTFS